MREKNHTLIQKGKLNQEALFSILIPSWNNLSYLKLCVESIFKNSHYKHQILVHANEGLDGTLDWLKQFDFTVTHSGENIGVCYALNTLAEYVDTSYILYMNDDMFVAKDWDLHLYNVIQAKGDNLFYYSATMVEFEESNNKAALAPYDFGKTHDTFDESAFNLFVKNNVGKDWFGSCWPPSIVHKDLWFEAGGYDNSYSPGFYSDPDFAMRLWQLGVRDFRGIGSSLVYHFKCKSTGRVQRNNGRKTFASKWGIPASFLYKKILKMGEPFKTEIQLKIPLGPVLWLAKLKAKWISLN